MQKLRVRYAKRGPLRFTSHRDFARAFERAVRRARLPIAYSAGFSPHPKISYLGAAPTGVASEAEYLEISLIEERDPDDIRAALDAALSPGLDIVDVVVARGGSLPERIDASLWEIALPGTSVAVAQQALSVFLGADSVLVQRRTKDGTRTLDARAQVRHAEIVPGGACAILRCVVTQATPAVRPDDVLSGLREVAGLAPSAPPEATRLAQGLLDEAGRLADPLAPDRAAPVAP